MQMYFSGIDGQTVKLIHQAGLNRLVVNPQDIALAAGGHLGLDSGAYPAFKGGTVVHVEKYLATVAEIRRNYPLDWAAMPDVIGDDGETHRRWAIVRKHGLMPVWHWGAPRDWLDLYLAETPVVGIGGLVSRFRNRWDEKLEKTERAHWDRERGQTLAELIELCQVYPQRFYIFGLCWPKAVEALRTLIVAGDSSLWLAGRRYRYAIFKHTGNGHLQAAPAKFLPGFKGLNGDQLATANAQTLAAYCETGETLPNIDSIDDSGS